MWLAVAVGKFAAANIDVESQLPRTADASDDYLAAQPPDAGGDYLAAQPDPVAQLPQLAACKFAAADVDGESQLPRTPSPPHGDTHCLPESCSSSDVERGSEHAECSGNYEKGALARASSFTEAAPDALADAEPQDWIARLGLAPDVEAAFRARDAAARNGDYHGQQYYLHMGPAAGPQYPPADSSSGQDSGEPAFSAAFPDEEGEGAAAMDVDTPAGHGGGWQEDSDEWYKFRIASLEVTLPP